MFRSVTRHVDLGWGLFKLFVGVVQELVLMAVQPAVFLDSPQLRCVMRRASTMRAAPPSIYWKVGSRYCGTMLDIRAWSARTWPRSTNYYYQGLRRGVVVRRSRSYCLLPTLPLESTTNVGMGRESVWGEKLDAGNSSKLARKKRKNGEPWPLARGSVSSPGSFPLPHAILHCPS